MLAGLIVNLIELLILVLAVLAVPVVAVSLYDRLVLAPRRPLVADGVVAPGPRYTRIADNLLPFVLIAAVIRLGAGQVFGWFQLLVVPLSFLAVPVVLLCLYEKFVLAPARARTPAGFKPRPPLYVRMAFLLLPLVIAAVVLNIGVDVVFAWVKEISVPLSWVAVPVSIWCLIDSWFLAPRRRIAAGGAAVKDPPMVRVAYALLPLLIVAIIVRMITAETLDFSLVLLLLSIGTGSVWALDSLVFRKRRLDASAKVPGGPVPLPEPGTVDYARSFFPVAVIVLVVRAFIFEPFRIPSDSMMPTLLDGDFIVVNKYAYGLRLPVLNRKFLDNGSPQRGDVVVFRHPENPSVNYIKRLVGLPGDRVEVRNDQLIINGEPVPMQQIGEYTDGCYVGLRLSVEQLGEHTHQVMSCRSGHGLLPSQRFGFSGDRTDLPACDRKKLVRDHGSYLCEESLGQGSRDSGDETFPIVPPGHYLMIGDNRDNSQDSREWRTVPDENLVGKATRIWLNFDPGRKKMVNRDRIFQSIE